MTADSMQERFKVKRDIFNSTEIPYRIHLISSDKLKESRCPRLDGQKYNFKNLNRLSREDASRSRTPKKRKTCAYNLGSLAA